MRGISDDELDCLSFLVGFFSAMPSQLRRAWFDDPQPPSLLIRNRVLILPVTNETRLPSAFRREWPTELDTVNLWEIRRLRPGAPPTQTFVEGSVLHQCIHQLDGCIENQNS